ncbi:MAG: DHHA1 domain-containing protein, partial [Atopostipes suicloacalis]|nr:DHHA1 domain-containing protein [Atopostipes suicloacalis]
LNTIIYEDEFADKIPAKSEGQLIFDQTPFYAEKGGQVGDRGVIRDSEGRIIAQVLDTKPAPGGQSLHRVEVSEELILGEIYSLEVQTDRRLLIERNHTATHLLHQALKDVVGEHVNQAGSLVTADQLRFDFTHLEKLAQDEIEKIEKIVNEKIVASYPVETTVTSIKKAQEMGAMALFGEKYGDTVRVVSVNDYSLELCGGNHVKNTSDIGLFKITSESGIGAGVRRIVARTSEGALEWIDEKLNILSKSVELTRAQTSEEVINQIKNIYQELQDLRKENESLQAKLSNVQAADIFGNVIEAGDFTIISEQVDVKNMGQLRKIADNWTEENPSDVLVLALAKEEKVNMLVAMNDFALESGLKAGDLIKTISPKIGGGGGGRPKMAQAGGKNPAGIDEAFAEAFNWLKKQRE